MRTYLVERPNGPDVKLSSLEIGECGVIGGVGEEVFVLMRHDIEPLFEEKFDVVRLHLPLGALPRAVWVLHAKPATTPINSQEKSCFRNARTILLETMKKG